MTRRAFWTAGFLTLTFGAIVMELIGAWDHDRDTVTYTELIVSNIPEGVTLAVLSAFIAWVRPHLIEAYRKRKEKTMAQRPRPVLVLFAVSAAIAAVVGTAGATDVLPKQVVAWLIIANAVLTAVGGVLVQDLVTPLSAPVSADGVPLVPADSSRAAAQTHRKVPPLPTG